MNKQEFLAELGRGLIGLPQENISERLTFYSEMIDDRIEEGFTEEAAVAAIGPVDEVITQITSEIPLKRIVREKVRSNRSLKAWEIILLVLGAPVWIPLLLALGIIILSLYIVVWAFVISFFAVTFGLAVGCIGCIAAIFYYGFAFRIAAAGLASGSAIICAGLAILFFLLSVQIAKGAIKLLSAILTGFKSLFIGREKY